MAWPRVRDRRTAVCGTNFASRQVLFGFLTLTCKVFRFFLFCFVLGSFAWEMFGINLEDLNEMPKFQLCNEKLDLTIWGPYSHTAT